MHSLSLLLLSYLSYTWHFETLHLSYNHYLTITQKEDRTMRTVAFVGLFMSCLLHFFSSVFAFSFLNFVLKERFSYVTFVCMYFIGAIEHSRDSADVWMLGE